MPDSRPADYQKECYLNGLHGIRPSYPFHNKDWASTAKSVLPANAWGYVNGNAGLSQTHDNNIRAFQDWHLIPKRLTVATTNSEANQTPKIGVTVLGMDLPSPIMIAPVGVLKLFHADRELGVARAARECKVPYILSTASASSIEEVAEASG
jgi:lactate 2-monooxygenase